MVWFVLALMCTIGSSSLSARYYDEGDAQEETETADELTSNYGKEERSMAEVLQGVSGGLERAKENASTLKELSQVIGSEEDRKLREKEKVVARLEKQNDLEEREAKASSGVQAEIAEGRQAMAQLQELKRKEDKKKKAAAVIQRALKKKLEKKRAAKQLENNELEGIL